MNIVWPGRVAALLCVLVGTCAQAGPTLYTVGGTVTGLSGELSLSSASTGSVSIHADGAFAFPARLAKGAAYTVYVHTAPATQSCTLANGSGAVGAGAVTSIAVSCKAIATPSTAVSWTWDGGSAHANAAAHFGAKGTAAAGNTPGARTNGSRWTDKAGNLWLFGGLGNDASGAENELNDLWMFTPAARTWTWIAGGQRGNTPGNYGQFEQPGVGTSPGARDSAATWTDAAGQLWMFGGSGLDATTSDANSSSGSLLADLWKFSPGKNEWTWVGGWSTGGTGGVYGTKGSGNPGTIPGGRFGASTWVDRAGNLWLFGGYGIDISGNARCLNDLWSYSATTGIWTWVAGASSGGQSGSYTSNAKTPGARYYANAWTDAQGSLWLFGGTGFDSAGNFDALNDLWKFTPSTGAWSWVSGASSIDASGIYGMLGVGAAGNTPGARSAAATRIDAIGNLWLLGGDGFDAHGDDGKLNDLWRFTPSTGRWAWMGGANTVDAESSFGTLTVASLTASPGARSGAAAWTDTAGHLWLFGGSGSDGAGGSGLLNDLWLEGGP
jgi:N-acetylneuraminic acid mutarotase